jgi:dTDP-glucose 4,6-dehydratase
MKVLVTGGAGFIGSNFVRMAAQGLFPDLSEVIVLDSLTYAGNLDNLSEVLGEIEFIQGDICDEGLVQGLVSRVDGLINFAAESHVDRSILNPNQFLESNFMGVHNLLEASKNRDGFRFLQVSTDEVYGSIQEGSWNENEPLMPNSPYSASKASADLLVRSYAKTFDMNTVVTRCSNNYGPYQFPEKIIPYFVTRLLSGKKVTIYGNGLNSRDWLHVDDHCRGIYGAFSCESQGEVFNIGGGKELNNLDLTYKILDLLGKSKSEIEFINDRKGHDFRYSVNHTKATSEFNYKPEISFEIGLENTVKWYVQHPDWWKKLVTL